MQLFQIILDRNRLAILGANYTHL